MTKLDRLNLFYTQFTLDFIKVLDRYRWKAYVKLHERNKIIDRDFKFNKRNIEKFERLNEELRKHDLKVMDHLKNLNREGRTYLKKKTMDDHMISVKLEFYSSSRYYTSINKEMYGNPIATITMCFGANRRHYTKNWNELRDDKTHPLAKLKFSYSFYYLYFMSHLAKADMMRIDQIWYDIEVAHQFTADLKNGRPKNNV